MKWISVNDKLPRKDQRVLIIASERDGSHKDKFVGTLEDDNKISWIIEAQDCCCRAWFNDEIVTHWMELPKGPDEEFAQHVCTTKQDVIVPGE